jgi:N-methylhydantoinase B
MKAQRKTAQRKNATRKAASRKTGSRKPKVDPITLSVVRGVLDTTQREMTLSLEKTARSSVFNLAHDYTTALFNAKPEMILQGQDIPIHLGSLIPAMKQVAKFFGDDIHEGDLLLHNDPAYGGSHAIDLCMYKPVFYKGKLRYWTVCKGHLTDIGGGVPAGYNPGAKEIYAECLRIPPIKIWDRGKPRTDVINMVFTNMRARRDQEGDFNALIGACQVGERNLLSMPASTSCSTWPTGICAISSRPCPTEPMKAWPFWRMPATASVISRSRQR